MLFRSYALEILTRPDRGRMMGEMARVNARRRYCSNDIIPQYEAYYDKVLTSVRPTVAVGK